MCTGHISCYPYTRTSHTIHEWMLLIVTSERDNQNCRVSVSRRIYNTENSTDQLETGVSKHFFRL